MRKPTQSDVESAQRGLRMVSMSIAELRELAAEHAGKEMFASKVIYEGARQMIAAKRRVGARENPRARKRNPTGDEVTAHELALYAVNNAELYRQRIVPVIENLQKKIKKGIYDPALALKLWRYVADDAAKRYTFEFDATPPSKVGNLTGKPRTFWEVKGYGIFTVPIRLAAAREIAAHYSAELKRNPSLRVRATGARGVKEFEKFQRGIGRMQMGLARAQFHVQVQRGKGWITLGAFQSKAMATDYGRALAHRYRSKKFRVFWPDAKNNPIPRQHYRSGFLVRMITVYAHHNGYGDLSGEQVRAISGSPARVIKVTESGRGKNRITRLLVEIEYAGRIWYGWIDPDNLTTERQNPRRRKNPAPLASRVNGAEVDRAARLFQQFTGQRVTRARQVRLPQPKVGLAIGPVLGISYATTRDGKRENYLHEFRRGARPLLAASQDGRTLMLLGGGHRFTPRGIVDQR